jgi:hypothetical protein
VPENSWARAYCIFSAAFGIAWFPGSALLGALHDISIPLVVVSVVTLVAVSVVTELTTWVPFVLATRPPRF